MPALDTKALARCIKEIEISDKEISDKYAFAGTVPEYTQAMKVKSRFYG